MPTKRLGPGDLHSLADLYHVQTRESSQELEARLRREEADAAHQREKDKIILWAVLVVVGVVSALCVVLLFLPWSNPETQKWASTLLTTVVAGGVGYMTGKGSK